MKVSWDHYSQYMESHKIPWFQTTNQKIMLLHSQQCKEPAYYADQHDCGSKCLDEPLTMTQRPNSESLLTLLRKRPKLFYNWMI